MRGTVLYGPRDVRREEQRDQPRIINPTDAIVRISATCVCGFDLWPYRDIFDLTLPLEQGAEGYPAMDERHAVKTLLRP